MKTPRNQRKAWVQPLADLVSGAINPVLAKQGFGQADVILNWEEIAGARLAAVCEPIKLQWPTRPKNAPPDSIPEPATLIVRVEGGFALELQHMASALIERVNSHLGWRCVGKISMRQGPLERPNAPKPKPRPPGAQALAEAGDAVAGVEDEALRQALTRLGARIIESGRKA
jgi:hypothetical protein